MKTFIALLAIAHKSWITHSVVSPIKQGIDS
jgi:hypothetical protein